MKKRSRNTYIIYDPYGKRHGSVRAHSKAEAWKLAYAKMSKKYGKKYIPTLNAFKQQTDLVED